MANEADLRALYPFLHGAPQESEKLEVALLQFDRGEGARLARDQRSVLCRRGRDPVRRRQDGRRCLPARRPLVLDGQRRVELRCLACRG